MSPGSKNEEKIDPVFKDICPPDPNKEEDPEIQKIITLKGKGYTLRQIASETNRSKEYVRTRLMEAGIDTARGDGKTAPRPRDISPILFFDDETIAYIISFPFQYMAKRHGDFWLLSKDEEKQISSIANKVTSKWTPRWLINYSEEIALVSLIFALVYPRYLMTKALVEEREKKGSAEKIQTLSPGEPSFSNEK